MKSTAVTSARTRESSTVTTTAEVTTTKPARVHTAEARPAANDEVHAGEQHINDNHDIGPLWVITIAMGVFFGIAALVLMLG